MGTEKRLFIVSNSTHYLNLNNYIETNGKAQDFLILLLKNSKDDKILLEKVKQNSDIRVLKIFKYNINSLFPFHYLDILLLVNEINKFRKLKLHFNSIFFSNYDSWIHHYIIKQFETERIVLLSDGTGIFDTIELRKKSRKEFRFSASKLFINKILQIPSIDNIHFYSPVEIEVANYDTLEVFNFKKSLAARVERNKVYFVGSPLVEKGFILLNAHLKNLCEIKNKFPNQELYYLAHRVEKVQNLNQYKKFGIIVPYSIPFEERLEKAEEIPGTIISYLSSVLINLPQIYPQLYFLYYPILTVDIPESSAFRERYANLIANFEKIQNSNIRILN